MEYNTRILVVDDNESIHGDFRKVLVQETSVDHAELDEMEAELFGSEPSEGGSAITHENNVTYEVDSAFQGQEALKMVEKAEEEGRPYALVFMDVRMPPGWDGIETISRIWLKHPYLEMVLCTAYSDYTWDDIVAKLGSSDIKSNLLTYVNWAAAAESFRLAKASGLDTDIFLEAVRANGRPTVKLSDNPNKAMGPASEIERYKRVFNVGQQQPLTVEV